MQTTHKRLITQVAFLALGALGAQAHAQPFNFTPRSTGNSFETPTNWTPNGPPGPASDARFGSIGFPVYSVFFNSSPTNAALLVERGDVEFRPLLPTGSLPRYTVTGSGFIDGGAGTHLTLRGRDFQGFELNVNRDFTVGTFNHGRLTLESRTRLNSNSASIGAFTLPVPGAAPSTGEVTVRGFDAFWDIATSLRVGSEGNGTLVIENNARVENQAASIGALPGGSGEVTVRGSLSRWNNDSNLFIGGQGDGVLTIEDDGFVTSQDGRIATSQGGSGTAIVRDRASWNSTNLVVSENGDGRLTIESGGIVRSVSGAIAEQAAGAGAVTVQDPGSNWNLGGNLTVGGLGDGDLTILNGGLVSSTTAVISDGGGFAGRGEVNVSGAGSVWDISVGLTIGNRGPAAMTIARGGQVDVNGNAAVAANGDSATLAFGIGDNGAGAIASGLLTVDGQLSRGVAAGGVLLDLLVDPGVPLRVGDAFTLVDYGSLAVGFGFDNVADDSILTTGRFEFLVDLNADLTGNGDLGIVATVVTVPEPASLLLVLPFLAAAGGRRLRTTRRT